MCGVGKCQRIINSGKAFYHISQMRMRSMLYFSADYMWIFMINECNKSNQCYSICEAPLNKGQLLDCPWPNDDSSVQWSTKHCVYFTNKVINTHTGSSKHNVIHVHPLHYINFYTDGAKVYLHMHVTNYVSQKELETKQMFIYGHLVG